MRVKVDFPIFFVFVKKDQLEKMNDQMLESEKTISGELRSLTNRLEEANQDKGMFWVIARAKVASSGW